MAEKHSLLFSHLPKLERNNYMGLFAPPAPGSLLKTVTVKAAEPIKKKVSGEKATGKDKPGRKADMPAEEEEANEE